MADPEFVQTRGVEAARAELGDLVLQAKFNDTITFLTRNGTRTAAIVSADDAECLLREVDQPFRPEVARLVLQIEGWLNDLVTRRPRCLTEADLPDRDLGRLDAYIGALHFVTQRDLFAAESGRADDRLVHLREYVADLSAQWTNWCGRERERETRPGR